VKILVISSILPIPGVIEDNDFIYHLYSHFRDQNKDDEIVIVKPVKYDFNIRTILRGKTRLQMLRGKREWEVKGFKVLIFPFFSAWTIRNLHALASRSIYFLNRRRISTLMKSSSFDLIHARFIFADGMLAYQLNRRFKIPYLVSTHKELFYFDHFYSRKIAFRILRQAKMLLPVSFINMSYFRDHGIPQAYQLTHGFYKGFFKDQRIQTGERVRILTVCRLLKYKNIDMVIRALGMLKDRYNFEYTLIGNGPELEHLQGLVDDQGLENNVIFIDNVPHEQISDEMYQFDMFIMPSYFETFGRVYFEVMAMGIPVICARNSGIYGLFGEKEEGLAVDHTSVGDISEALVYLIGDREERMRIGKNGQELVKNYTWENIAGELRQYYTTCLNS